MGRTGKPGHVREQVLSRPALLREITPKFDRLVRETIDHRTCLDIARVFAFGCGDSHNASLTAQMAFQQWARLPMEALTALQFARYTTPWLQADRPRQPLAIGISVSGEVARTVEGIILAREAGAYTLGITCHADSRIVRAAHTALDVSVLDMDIPRVRTFVATQVALYMVALRLAEVRGAMGYRESRTIRDHFGRAADITAATLEAINDTIRQLAQHLKGRGPYVFVGGGPNLGSAMFGAAKILEAEGSHAQGQDLEEWVHLQRFVRQAKTPTFLLAPPGLGYSRAVEVARVMRQVDCYLVAVVEEGDQEIARLADVILPIRGTLPEALTPLIYSSPLELFASGLAEAMAEPYFRGFDGRWATPDGDPIWVNETIESRDRLAITL